MERECVCVCVCERERERHVQCIYTIASNVVHVHHIM